MCVCAGAGRICCHSLVVETFWRRLQEIIPCRTIQRRSHIGAKHSGQMVQFPSLEECKKGFRQHMADGKWIFQGEISEEADMEIDESPNPESESAMPIAIHGVQASASTLKKLDPDWIKRWNACIAGVRGGVRTSLTSK